MKALDAKIEIARKFVDAHCYGLDAWMPKFTNPSMHDDAALIQVYYDMIGGLYGECRMLDGSEFEIEIPASDSHSGYPILFNFESIGDEL
jgi:hypothetical protein